MPRASALPSTFWACMMAVLPALLCALPAAAEDSEVRLEDHVPVDIGNDSSVSPFVIDGKEASRNQFPQMVSIQTTGHFCGGVIIDRNWILTAAHCLENARPSSVSMLAGTTDNRSGGVRIRAAEFRPHRSYVAGFKAGGRPSTTFVHDIALIKTQSPIQLSNSVRVATLDKTAPKDGDKAVVAGWGRTSTTNPNSGSRTLQFADQTIVSNSQCEGALRGHTIGADQVCASAPGNGNQASCQGDSGGPLFRNGWVVGLVSWSGSPCGRFPGVYASIAHHMPWIRQQTGLSTL